MYIHYSTGNISGPWTLVRIVEVSVIGGVHFRRFHCKDTFARSRGVLISEVPLYTIRSIIRLT